MPQDAQDDTPKQETPGGRKRRRRRRRRRRESASLQGLERMIARLGGAEGALLSTMGMVPAFATAESMLTASQAQGQMMLGAVANQQRMNSLALIATGGCVMQMLRLGETALDEDEEDDEMTAQMLRGLTGQGQY